MTRDYSALLAASLLPLTFILGIENVVANSDKATHIRHSHVEHMATDTDAAKTIANSMARLITDRHGAAMTLQTSELPPGHVTTAWWVIMNQPDRCESRPCSAKDVIERADIVGTQIVFADGVVNKADGTASFTGYLERGKVPNGWYQSEFANPQSAEIHLVLNDHGPLIPELAASMLTSYRGGCRDESLPPPFPVTAKVDGKGGPNTCRLIQDAIFDLSDMRDK